MMYIQRKFVLILILFWTFFAQNIVFAEPDSHKQEQFTETLNIFDAEIEQTITYPKGKADFNQAVEQQYRDMKDNKPGAFQNREDSPRKHIETKFKTNVDFGVGKYSRGTTIERTTNASEAALKQRKKDTE